MKSIEEVQRVQLKVEIKAEMNSLTFDENKQTATVLDRSKDKMVRRRRVSLESDDEDDNIETHLVLEEQAASLFKAYNPS